MTVKQQDQAEPASGSRTQLHEELELRRKELAVLHAIAGVAARSPDINGLLEQVLARLLEAMELEAGAIFLLNTGGDELIRAASLGFSEHYQRTATQVRLGRQLSGRVAQTGQPLFEEDINKNWRLSSIVKQREGVRSFAAIPLSSKGRVLGVMDVVSRESHPFKPPDKELLLSVGRQLSVTIDNAQIFDTSSRKTILEDRNWLAREIHDTLSQGLVALTLQLELAVTQLSEELDTPAAEASLSKALDLARHNLEEARWSVMHLRGDRMVTQGLPNAVGQLVREFARDTGTDVRAYVSKRLGSLPIYLEDGLYRITQEALNNIRKHAMAGQVRVSLQRKDGEVRLTVRDNGIGFNPLAGPHDGHFGIRGMGERAGLLGGRLDVVSRPGRGSLIRAVIPLRHSV